MKVLAYKPYSKSDFPDGIFRLEYKSFIDGLEDWALIYPNKKADLWIVCLHGHGSSGDQLYVREDIKDSWLPAFIATGAGILTPNLRGNAWMCPSAVEDMNNLLNFIRTKYHAKKFIFASGSMGATSNLIYAILHPEDVSGIIALGAVADIAKYYFWCKSKTDMPILQEIAEAIENSYGGSPQKVPEIYSRHCVLDHYETLTMPVYLAHGSNDKTMPVEQSRNLSAVMQHKSHFIYNEVSEGGHDSPLPLLESALNWIIAMAKL